ncbi:MAG: pilus assembly PilX N-terminal domain-containing protein [Rubrivivax sp.]|nr:pilus assembly PilX N-terminal domain-containing protein [Rubrivivax sp.]
MSAAAVLPSPNCRRIDAARGLSRRQTGAATLIVVMVLFFVVSLVAAYASRNLLFEQKTAANQYRSTAVLEAADAGLHWATSMLNSGRIGATCLPSANPADTSFRERYLAIADDGVITPLTLPPPPALASPLTPSCVFDGVTWQCSCPVNAAPVLAAPAGDDMFPAFRLRFVAMPTRPGLVRVEVNACSRADDACLNFPATGAANEARVTVSAIVALKGGVATVPAAALTARGSVDLSLSALTLANTDPRSGVTVNAGQAFTQGLAQLVTVAGSPAAGSISDSDPALGGLTLAPSNTMFAKTFGMWPADYRAQPGAVVLPCGGTCTAAQVRTAVAQYPGLVIWVDGALDIDTGGDIGTFTQPVAIVATGGVQFTAAATVYGLIYTQAAPWTTAGAGAGVNPTVRGAVVAEGNVDGNSAATLVYDATVLNRLRLKTGSFVVVPGSWRDF